jgi:hypothetical protein
MLLLHRLRHQDSQRAGGAANHRRTTWQWITGDGSTMRFKKNESKHIWDTEFNENQWNLMGYICLIHVPIVGYICLIFLTHNINGSSYTYKEDLIKGERR